MSCISNKFSLKKSGVVCSRYGLQVIFLIICLCNFSRGLSVFAWAKSTWKCSNANANILRRNKHF